MRLVVYYRQQVILKFLNKKHMGTLIPILGNAELKQDWATILFKISWFYQPFQVSVRYVVLFWTLFFSCSKVICW